MNNIHPEKSNKIKYGNHGTSSMTILMISDFVYPGLGGVETHIYNLSTCLIEFGFRIIIFTHGRNDRIGVRYMTNGVKVYYYEFPIMYENCIWADAFGLYGVLREICVRECVDIIHTHQTPSTMTLQSALHAYLMGIPCIFTDHSLFGFQDNGAIHLNKLLRFFISNLSACISVSHTNKENLALRGTIDPNKIFVIPNAIDGTIFRPSHKTPEGYIKNIEVVNIVTIGRMTYRKGTDLLCGVIIKILKQFGKKVRFLIGGDGPKKVLLEELRENFGLHDQLILLGALTQEQVRNTLKKGHIFLNTSFTEAFCISILEAACSGLMIVSTNVGGINEVLPPKLVHFVNTNVEDLANATSICVDRVLDGKLNPWDIHRQSKTLYSWYDVANRAVIVYKHVLSKEIYAPMDYIKQCILQFNFSKLSSAIVFAIVWIYHVLYNIWRPVESISIGFHIN